MTSEIALRIGAQKAAGARVESTCQTISQEWNTFVAEVQATSGGLTNGGMPIFAEAMGTWSDTLSAFSSRLMSYGVALGTVDDRATNTDSAVSNEFEKLARRLEGH